MVSRSSIASSTTVFEHSDEVVNSTSLTPMVEFDGLFLNHYNREQNCFHLTCLWTTRKWRRIQLIVKGSTFLNELQAFESTTAKLEHVMGPLRLDLHRGELPFMEGFITTWNLSKNRTDGRRKVVVTSPKEEDHYCTVAAVADLRTQTFSSDQMAFEGQLGAYTYKIRIANTRLVLKEIYELLRPEQVLYEIRALNKLSSCRNVLKLHGLWQDSGKIRGLIVDYHVHGSLFSQVAYHDSGWERRMAWGIQIVTALSHIHEHGFIHRALDLRSCIIDDEVNVLITGFGRWPQLNAQWKAPENRADEMKDYLSHLYYTNSKTDLYHLGMILWSLTTDEEHPEDRRTLHIPRHDFPPFWDTWLRRSLSTNPVDRLSAKEMVQLYTRHLQAQAPDSS